MNNIIFNTNITESKKLASSTPLNGSNVSAAFTSTMQNPVDTLSILSSSLTDAPTSDLYPYLAVEGITIKTVIAEDGTIFIFPLGGEPWAPYLPASEAWGYAMRNAVLYKDKALFQGLLNSYLYCANLTVRCYEKTGPNGMYEWAPFAKKFGLMGWELNVWENPPRYDGEYYCGAATDGDLDIAKAMMMAYEVFGNLEAYDPINTPPVQPNFNPEWIDSHVEVPFYSKIDLKSLVTKTIQSIMNFECGSYTTDQVNTQFGWDWLRDVPSGVPMPGADGHIHMLQPNDWEYQTPVYMDYFDPECFVMMINFLQNQGLDASALESTLRDTLLMINAYSITSGGWIADTFNTDIARAGPNSFTAEGLRFLMRFGEFVGNAANKNSPYFDIAAQILQRMVRNCINTMEEHSMGDGWTTWAMGGLAKSSFTSPLLLAMSALRSSGYAPENLTDAIYQKTIQFFMEDMDPSHDFAGFDSWTVADYNNQGHYFDLELGLLCQGIMADLNILPQGIR